VNVRNSSQAKDRFNLLLKNSERLFGRFPSDACAAGFRELKDAVRDPWMVVSLNLDPYWPKWNSPWWYLTLCLEMGCTSGVDHAGAPAHLSIELPTDLLEHFAARVNEHYLQSFPIKEEELPAGADPMRHILCFCAMGTAVQILEHGGIASDERIPWLRPWFERYQMADGGYNCDEAAYLNDQPRSSIVSTVPMLEALMKLSQRGLSARESAILDNGISYLLKRSLFKSICKNAPIDPNFSRLTFPRFYEYDVLRGLSLVCNWAVRFKKTLPFSAIEEVLDLCCSKIRDDGQLYIERQFYADKKTPMCKNGEWTRGHDVSVFTLLSQAGALETPSPALTIALMNVLKNLSELDERGSIEF
jgi:hypothetical protein